MLISAETSSPGLDLILKSGRRCKQSWLIRDASRRPRERLRHWCVEQLTHVIHVALDLLHLGCAGRLQERQLCLRSDLGGPRQRLVVFRYGAGTNLNALIIRHMPLAPAEQAWDFGVIDHGDEVGGVNLDRQTC